MIQFLNLWVRRHSPVLLCAVALVFEVTKGRPLATNRCNYISEYIYCERTYGLSNDWKRTQLNKSVSERLLSRITAYPVLFKALLRAEVRTRNAILQASRALQSRGISTGYPRTFLFAAHCQFYVQNEGDC